MILSLCMAKGKKGGKAQRRDEQERKRDERARRNALRKEKDNLEHDGDFVSFSNQLQVQGLKIKEIIGDGNCLFRALGDQLDGDHTTHARHRRETVDFIRTHRKDFEPFMEDNISFEKHLQELSKPGTFGGNDSIVAFARNHGVKVIIHQLNEPRWVINGSEYSKTGQVIELHISYHNGEHYSSVRSLFETDNSAPAWPYFKDRNFSSVGKKPESTDKKSKSNQTKRLGAAAKHNHDQSFAAQVVMEATGCKDLALVTQTLEENMYDIDSSISYVLQMMCVAEDQGFAANDLCFDEDQTDATDTLGTSGKNVGREHSSALSDVDTTCNRDDLNERTQECQNGTVKDCKSSVSGESTTTRLEPRDGIDTDTNSVDCSDTSTSMNSCTKQNKPAGARPKDPAMSKSNTTQKNTPHLSNKKRKELAKQVKKTNRDERRKQATEETNTNNDETPITSIMPDLGALAI